MNARQNRRQRFISAHPSCCYCSGARATSEVDHNPPRGLFPRGAAPKGLRFPSCSECNAAKKDAESRAALVANTFSRIEPPNVEELRRSVRRGLEYFARDADFRASILGHPTQAWDFARGANPGDVIDPMSAIETPHTLPASFSEALLELGKFFGQAMYYLATKRVMSPTQQICVHLATNAASQEHRGRILAVGENLKQFVAEPADRRHMPLFGFGLLYFDETSTLYFTGERRGAFAWVGLAGSPGEELLGVGNSRAWWGDGRAMAKGDGASVLG